MNLKISSLFLLILAGSVGFPLLLVYFYRLSRKSKKTPLTRNLLRSPGQHLREQIDVLSDKLGDYLLFVMFGPVLIYVLVMPTTSQSETSRNIFYFFSGVATLILLFLYYRLWRTLMLRASYVLGLDGELHIGQELNNLMLQGCRVYHDFPADEFNIDHIVIGPKGVFAVETKARMKRRIKGGDAVKVRYDGTTLHFPGWSEHEPVEQAKAQAAWLAKWLRSAVGERVDVRPVLAIPGWFLLKESPDSLLLFNGSKPEVLLSAGNILLSPQLIQRIAHQVEQRCRNVEPFESPQKS